MELKIKIYSVYDKLPESNWSKLQTRCSKHCLVWNGFEQPLFAYYDKERHTWYSDDTPICNNWIDDVEYWAEIPDFNTFYDSLKKESNLCCCGNQGEEKHICPYKEDIHGDTTTLCNCCDSCYKNCCDDI